MNPKALFIICLIICTGAFAGPVLVRDGAPKAVIVTATAPSESARRAAKELQRVIEQMSGASLPIIDESAKIPAGQTRVWVGRSSLVSDTDIPSGEDRDFSKEGFLIRTGADHVLLAGNEAGFYRGVEYAVYELLERLGCRWFFPGQFGEVIPKLPNITLPDIDTLQKPDFVVRNIWTSGWTDAYPGFGEWLIRNKGTDRSAFAFPADGTIWRLAPPGRFAAEYPELSAMGSNGKRQGAGTSHENVMLCLSNSNALDIAAATVLDFFKANPRAGSYAFSAPDNAAVCYCPECRLRCRGFKQDSGIDESISELYFNFVNNLAWRVGKVMPDKRIVTLAYATRVWPPDTLEQPWNTNIIVQIAQLRTSVLRPINEPNDFFAMRRGRTLQAWSRFGSKLLIYDYDPHADISRMPFWQGKVIAEDLRTYRKNGVIGIATEGNHSLLRVGLNYYIRARCMWNMDTDPDATLVDFAEKFFASASEPMKEYLRAVETMLRDTPDSMAWHPLCLDWTPTYPPGKMAALSSLLDAAAKHASDDVVAKRVRAFRIAHEYALAYLDAHALAKKGAFQEALEKTGLLTALIHDAQEIQPGLMPPDPGWVRNEGSGLTYLTNTLAAWADRSGGALGECIGRAGGQAGFLKDPGNTGLFEQWQKPDVSAKLDWQPVSLDVDWGLSGFRDEQGYAYDGIGWYRVVLPVAASWQGRARLLLPLVFADQAWVWVNGRMVCSPPQLSASAQGEVGKSKALFQTRRGYASIEMDVQDALVPGQENVITCRLAGSPVRTQHRGLAARPWVWATR